MKAEKIILSFIAVIVGLIAAGVAFYLYQMTKTVPESKTQLITVKKVITQTPTPDTQNYLTIENPKDENVFKEKNITISGKTTPGATIIVSTENNDQVITPAANGNFSLNTLIDNGTTLLQITSIFPNGEQKKINRTVTYSTEDF